MGDETRERIAELEAEVAGLGAEVAWFAARAERDRATILRLRLALVAARADFDRATAQRDEGLERFARGTSAEELGQLVERSAVAVGQGSWSVFAEQAVAERDEAIEERDEARALVREMWTEADGWAGPRASSHYRSKIKERVMAQTGGMSAPCPSDIAAEALAEDNDHG